MVVATAYLISAVNIDKGSASIHNLQIGTAQPLSVIWPFEIAIVGDEGEKGLRIGPNIGRGWRNEAAGSAEYKFYLPADGLYTIWTYALWYDECSNAVFAQIDDQKKAILGNDPVYNQWHWIRGFSIDLKKGSHTLQLSNHSDNIAVQKLFLTNSALTVPKKCESVFADIYYDGFDGCDQGNFPDWQKVKGQWKVYNPIDEMCYTENSLVGISQKSALILQKHDNWADYSLHVSVQSFGFDNPAAATGICFGLNDKSSYHLLKWHHIPNQDRVKMHLIARSTGNDQTLTDFEILWPRDRWHEIEIMLKPDCIKVTVDNAKTITIPIEKKITGGIGLFLEGKTTAYFDNIHVRQVKKAPTTNNEF